MVKLKVGIIGCGVIFNLNVLGYLDDDDAEITCLCDNRNKNAEEKVNKFNLSSEIRIYRNYEEMLDSEEIDILEILLPHHLHSEVTLYAAQKEIKGISVQKPMANSIEECDRMIKACKKNKIKLLINTNMLPGTVLGNQVFADETMILSSRQARDNFQKLPATIRNVDCSNCASCVIQCPNGVEVQKRLIRVQSLLG